jgi:hypothetical protein
VAAVSAALQLAGGGTRLPPASLLSARRGTLATSVVLIPGAPAAPA